MSNAQRTPEKWEYYRKRGNFYGIRRIGQSRNEAEIIDTYLDDAIVDNEAHAKLIAAAPDMAEALKGCLSGIHKGSVEYRMAVAALAKAGVE